MNNQSDTSDEQDALDWCRKHESEVAALAKSDREMADYARAFITYLRDEQDGFEDILNSPRGSWLTRSEAQQHARKIRDALTTEIEENTR